MIVFIRLDAHPCIVLIDTVICLHLVNNLIINWNGVNANLDPLEVGFAWDQIEPRMLANLLNSVPFFRVCVQNAVEQILGLI